LRIIFRPFTYWRQSITANECEQRNDLVHMNLPDQHSSRKTLSVRQSHHMAAGDSGCCSLGLRPYKAVVEERRRHDGASGTSTAIVSQKLCLTDFRKLSLLSLTFGLCFSCRTEKIAFKSIKLQQLVNHGRFNGEFHFSTSLIAAIVTTSYRISFNLECFPFALDRVRSLNLLSARPPLSFAFHRSYFLVELRTSYSSLVLRHPHFVFSRQRDRPTRRGLHYPT
jgi:hypothetical protein